MKKWFKRDIEVSAGFKHCHCFVPFRAQKKVLSVSGAGQVDILDQFRSLENNPPTPPIS